MALARNIEITVDNGNPMFPAHGKTRVLTASFTHVGTREYQQDAIFISPDTFFSKGTEKAFCILCDGMGGLENGGMASIETVDYFATRLFNLDVSGNITEMLLNNIDTINEFVRSMPDKDGNTGTAGTTLVMAVISEDKLYWVSVGDSRIYIIRGNEIVQVTKDHNYALELAENVAKGFMSSAEAEASPYKEALISYIGIDKVERVDYNSKPFQLLNNDIVLLCSDGLTKALKDDEIFGVINEHRSNLDETARMLVTYAFDKPLKGHDNTTIGILEYKSYI